MSAQAAAEVRKQSFLDEVSASLCQLEEDYCNIHMRLCCIVDRVEGVKPSPDKVPEPNKLPHAVPTNLRESITRELRILAERANAIRKTITELECIA